VPRPPKKKRLSVPDRPPVGGPSIDRGLMRPGWRERLEERAQERAQVERRHGPPMRPPPRKARLPKFLQPFEIWAPTEEELEAERAQAARARPLHETMVPEAEREYVRAQAEAWRRGERPAFERPSSPVYSQRAGPRRPEPETAARQITPDYLNQVFNFDKMWSHVRSMKKDPKFQKEAGVGVISPAGMDAWGRVLRVAEFFGIPERELGRFPREEAWDKFIKPFLSEVERVLNQVKPADLSGRFRFDSSPTGAFGLIYSE
jgi:hypothetical protein